jgi:hypothetical protein
LRLRERNSEGLEEEHFENKTIPDSRSRKRQKKARDASRFRFVIRFSSFVIPPTSRAAN